MKIKTINSTQVHDRKTGYSQAVCLADFDQIVFVSGQIPVRLDGSVPQSFKQQAKLTWDNVKAQLKQAGMGFGNIIHHRTYLADRKFAAENSLVRREVLGELEPALTVIIAGIFDDAWLLEIEVVAAQ